MISRLIILFLLCSINLFAQDNFLNATFKIDSTSIVSDYAFILHGKVNGIGYGGNDAIIGDRVIFMKDETCGELQIDSILGSSTFYLRIRVNSIDSLFDAPPFGIGVLTGKTPNFDFRSSTINASNDLINCINNRFQLEVDAIDLSGYLSGSLTTNTFPIATGSTTLGNSSLVWNPTYSRFEFGGTAGLVFPNGTTAQRSSVPTTGEARYNTSNGNIEIYGASAWEYFAKAANATGLIGATQVAYGDASTQKITSDNAFRYGGRKVIIGETYTTPSYPGRFNTSSTQSSYFFANSNSTSRDAGLFFQTNAAIGGGIYVDGSTQDFIFDNWADNNSKGFLFYNNVANGSNGILNFAIKGGVVGVATSDPNSLRPAAAITGSSGFVVYNPTTNLDAWFAVKNAEGDGLHIWTDASQNSYDGETYIDLLKGLTAHSLRIRTNALTSALNAIRVQADNAYVSINQRLNIGTETNARTLTVNGEARISDLITDTPTRVVGADADGDLGAISFLTLLDSLLANGLTSTNIYTSDGTAAGNRKYNANNTTLRFDNLAGLTFSGEGTVTIKDTLGSATLNITRNSGVNATAGEEIGRFNFQTLISGSESTVARISSTYNGSGTNRYSFLDFGLGQNTTLTNWIRILSSATLGDAFSPIIMGYESNLYPSTYTPVAQVVINSDAGKSPLSVESASAQKFSISEDGDVQANDYGDNNKTADDLSVTRAGLVLAPATDGIVYETGGVIFTQTAIDTVNNTASETSLINTGKGSVTLAADYLEAGRTIICRGSGWWSNNSVTPSLEFRQYIGATEVGDTGAGSMPDLSAGQEFWTYEAEMTCQADGVSGTVMTQGKWEWFYSDFTDGRRLTFSNTATATINTTASQTLDFTVQMGSADANAYVVMTNFYCEAKN